MPARKDCEFWLTISLYTLTYSKGVVISQNINLFIFFEIFPEFVQKLIVAVAVEIHVELLLPYADLEAGMYVRRGYFFFTEITKAFLHLTPPLLISLGHCLFRRLYPQKHTPKILGVPVDSIRS